jgi:hypothetical protein
LQRGATVAQLLQTGASGDYVPIAFLACAKNCWALPNTALRALFIFQKGTLNL